MSLNETTEPWNRHERRALEARGEPLAVPMSKAPEWLGISRSKIYEEIAAGRLKAVKCGSKTLVPYASGQAWLESLPDLAA
jgi:excisionase family DNA binding protein